MDIILVNLIGIGLIGLIAWYFWMSRPEGTAARTAGAGQEATIVVEGGYTPDTIRVRAGHPVRLTFERRESDPCSERVVLDAFGTSADLPRGRRVPVEFTPAEPGIYEFACQMGMLRGRIVATRPRPDRPSRTDGNSSSPGAPPTSRLSPRGHQAPPSPRARV